jgi:hypothetical protein
METKPISQNKIYAVFVTVYLRERVIISIIPFRFCFSIAKRRDECFIRKAAK